MKTLSFEAFGQAKAYIGMKGRKLDQSLFHYYFEKGTVNDVLGALALYQNGDGGFGHALEPDIFLPASSPFVTSVAFQVLSAVNAPSEHAMVNSGMKYLENSYDSSRGKWPTLPPAVNDYPRAIWWQYREDDQGRPIEGAWGNPTAEIVGYILQYGSGPSANWRNDLLDRSLQHFMGLDELDMHETLCYLRLAKHLSETDRRSVTDKVKRHLSQLVQMDPAEWGGYGLQPLQIADSPESPFYPEMKEAVDRNLDYIIDHQGEDGAWTPNWQWGQYEEDWPKALSDWKSHLTLHQLLTLRRYGRIEF
jgi:hypothetical protein